MNAFRTALGGLLLVITIAGCSGAAGPTVKPGETGSREPGPTTVPGDPGSGGGGQSGGSGGGVGGGGQVDPAPGGGDDGANLVVPKPGQLDPNPVFVTGLAVHIDGRQVSVRLTWWSGVEPCYVLDSVGVARDGRTIVLTAIEGHGPERVACIEIAQLKATIVDLGELEPGTYVIAAEPGDATPVTIEIT